MVRVRRSLQELELLYPTELEKVIRAFAALAAKPASDPDSFFNIAACHGEPLETDSQGNKPAPETWWGGYCTHGNVLFPTWHRAYLLRLEDAMRRVKGCEDVTIPFWDECLTPKNPVPKILTTKRVKLDGKDIPNPLYSYKLVAPIIDDLSSTPGNVKEMNHRYSKPVQYETVRFPLSGLVGTDQYKNDTKVWNQRFSDEDQRIKLLNNNIANWLTTDVVINPPNKETDRPSDRDLKSVVGRFRSCLHTKSYAIFSNTSTERDEKANPNLLNVSLESPHNSIHLAVGGFYQKGRYMADPDGFWEQNRGANGDMGCNETASFDPIFFFHHSFIDYVFWLWQRKHGKTAKGSIEIDLDGVKGTTTGKDSQPGLPPNTKLDMNTPLRPFRKPGRSGNAPSDFLTSNDLVDIEGQLDYKYGKGSLDLVLAAETPPELEGPLLAGASNSELHSLLRIDNINSSRYRGSFVIRAYAITPSGKKWEVGREAILGRWNTAGCGNCQSREEPMAYVSIFKDFADILQDGENESNNEVEYVVGITTSDPDLDFNGFESNGGEGPRIRNILASGDKANE